MRKILGVLALMCMFTSNAYATNWHNMSQSQRDLTIISAGLYDYGNYGGSCKEWVRAVVLRATGYHVWVGSNNSTQDAWLYNGSNDVDHVVKETYSITNVQYGDIIQMYNVSTGEPHTAIVVNNDGNGMTWLDSNWVATNEVGTHPVTFSYFNSKYGSRYTIYSIK